MVSVNNIARVIYSLKARRYSCQQNRNVRAKEVEEEEEEGEECMPSPLHLLLADRRLCAAARGEPCTQLTVTTTKYTEGVEHVWRWSGLKGSQS